MNPNNLFIYLVPETPHDESMPELLETSMQPEDPASFQTPGLIDDDEDSMDKLEKEEDLAEMFGDFEEDDDHMGDVEAQDDAMVSSCMKSVADHLQVL